PALTARVRERLPSSPEIVEIPDVCETPELIEATRALVALLQAKPASPALRARLRNIRRSPRAVAATLRTRARKIWRGNPKVVAARYYLSRSAYGLRHPDRAVRRVLVVAGVMRDHPKAPEDAFEP